MRRVGWCTLLLFLALQAAPGQDPPRDDKKPQPVREQYQALVKEFNSERSKLISEINKTMGEERTKLINQYLGFGKQYAEKFYKLAEDNPKDPVAAEALAWVVQNGTGSPIMAKAIDRLIENYPDSPALERVCATLARSPTSADTLKKILEKATQPRAKAAAAMALGQSLVAQTERSGLKPEAAEKVGAEAEKYLKMAAELYGKANATRQKEEAEQELKTFLTLRVGKEAPEITGPDLDGKEFKLSDYRGKVVLLDFWGDW